MTSAPPPHLFKELATIEERPFTSHPLVGPLIVKLRTWWNNISTKWYVRDLLAQQNEFNKQLVRVVNQQAQWLTLQDHKKTELPREVARLTTQSTTINQQPQTLESRLNVLEHNTRSS